MGSYAWGWTGEVSDEVARCKMGEMGMTEWLWCREREHVSEKREG